MFLLMNMMILIMIILMAITTMIFFISKKSFIEIQKSNPFECGFNPMSNKRLPFSIHFFLIAVIFLIFDIEIIIILPMIFTINSSILLYWLISCLFFIFILIIGLYYEWMNGMLNWVT